VRASSTAAECRGAGSKRVRGEASGVSVEGAFWFVFEVHDARVTRLSFYVRKDQALEAAGLRE
jgi:hypothetical protein